MHQVGNFGQQLELEGAIGQLHPQGLGVAGQVSAPFRAVQVAALTRGVDQEAAQGDGFAHIARKSLLAEFADEAVGVVLRWQEQKLDAAHIGGKGQGAVQRLARGAPAGGVAIEAEHHRIGKAKQLLHMLCGAGRAQRGHRVGKTKLGQRHHVHVTLGHQRIALLAQRVAGFKQAVQLAPLAEHRCFGGIEVFGFVVAQYPAAKAYAFTFNVADRKHHPVAKTVVTLFVLAFFRVQDHQATFHQQRVVIVGENAGQTAPALGRIAQAELSGNFTRQAATLEVVHRSGRFLEMLSEGVAGFFQHVTQGSLLLPLLDRAGPVLRAGVVFGHLQAVLLGQVFDGFHKGHAGVVHQKADGIAVLAAAKAVIELLGWTDRERG